MFRQVSNSLPHAAPFDPGSTIAAPNHVFENVTQIITAVPPPRQHAWWDMNSLNANPDHQEEAPVVFFSPGGIMDKRQPTTRGWVRSMQDNGYNIHNTHSGSELLSILSESPPKILCLSTNEYQLDYMREFFRHLSSMDEDQRPITIVGGLASVPHFASFFDIAVIGGGEVILPALINNLQRDIVEGKLSRSEMVETACNSSTTRLCRDKNDNLFKLPVPIAGRGGRIFMNKNGVPVEVCGNVQRSHSIWQESGGRNNTAFDQAMIPTARTPFDMDILFGGYNGLDSVTSQWGCAGRCAFCTIYHEKDSYGRHLSTERVVSIIEQAISKGYKTFEFDDDNFFHNFTHARSIINAIRSKGLHKRINIRIQTRADLNIHNTRIRKLVIRMRRMGITFGLGLETLDKTRAERMKKPLGRISGEEYIDKAKAFIRFLAEHSPNGEREKVYQDSIYLIGVSYGDTILDIARDILAQYRFQDELREIGYIIPFSRKIFQLPGFVDAASCTVVGECYPYLQPFEIDRPKEHPGAAMFNYQIPPSEERAVLGTFHVYRELDDGRVRGIFQPRSFRWAAYPFIDDFLWEVRKIMRRDITLAEFSIALEDAFERFKDKMPDDDRTQLVEYMEEIHTLRTRALDPEHVIE